MGRRGRPRGWRPGRAPRRHRVRQRRARPVQSTPARATSTRPPDPRPWSTETTSSAQRRAAARSPHANGASGAQVYIPAVMGSITVRSRRGFICFPRCGRIAGGQVHGAKSCIGHSDVELEGLGCAFEVLVGRLPARSRHLRGRPARMSGMVDTAAAHAKSLAAMHSSTTSPSRAAHPIKSPRRTCDQAST